MAKNEDSGKGKGPKGPGETQVIRKTAGDAHQDIEKLERAAEVSRAQLKAANARIAALEGTNADLEAKLGGDDKRIHKSNKKLRAQLTRAEGTADTYDAILQKYAVGKISGKNTPKDLEAALEAGKGVAKAVGFRKIGPAMVGRVNSAVKDADAYRKEGGPDGAGVPKGYVPAKEFERIKIALEETTRYIEATEKTQAEYVALEAERRQTAVDQALRDQKTDYERKITREYVPKADHREVVGELSGAQKEVGAAQRTLTKAEAELIQLRSEVSQLRLILQTSDADKIDYAAAASNAEALARNAKGLYDGTVAQVAARGSAGSKKK